MTNIIVDGKALAEKLAASGEDDLIELYIVGPAADAGVLFPAFLHLAAIHNKTEYRDLEGIDAYPAAVRIRQ